MGAVVILMLIVIGGNTVHQFATIRTYLYKTPNSEFTFYVLPEKGRDLEMMHDQFKEWQGADEKRQNMQLHRCHQKKLLDFWHWYDYSTAYYDYPLLQE